MMSQNDFLQKNEKAWPLEIDFLGILFRSFRKVLQVIAKSQKHHLVEA